MSCHISDLFPNVGEKYVESDPKIARRQLDFNLLKSFEAGMVCERLITRRTLLDISSANTLNTYVRVVPCNMVPLYVS